MLDKTLGYLLCCQSPALFLAALAFLVSYFAVRRRHRARAVLRMLLTILCAAGGVALYFLGMFKEYFTIRNFFLLRPAGWVGLAIVAFFVALSLVRAFFTAADARRAEKDAARAENQQRCEAALQEAAEREAAEREAARKDVPPSPAETAAQQAVETEPAAPAEASPVNAP